MNAKQAIMIEILLNHGIDSDLILIVKNLKNENIINKTFSYIWKNRITITEDKVKRLLNKMQKIDTRILENNRKKIHLR